MLCTVVCLVLDIWIDMKCIAMYQNYTVHSKTLEEEMRASHLEELVLNKKITDPQINKTRNILNIFRKLQFPKNPNSE